MDDFFIELNFKKYRIRGAIYGFIDTKSIVIHGFFIPALVLAVVIFGVIEAISKNPFFLIISIFLVITTLVFTPYRMYKKIPDYYRIRKVEKIIEEKKYIEFLEVLKANNRTAVLGSLLLSKIESDVINEDLLNTMDLTNSKTICENIAKYLSNANQELTLKVFEKLKKTSNSTHKLGYITILYDYDLIEGYITISEFLDYLENEETTIYFPFLFRILSFFKTDLHLVIPVIKKIFDAFPHYDIPFDCINLLKKTESEDAIQVLEEIKEKFSQTDLKTRIDLAIKEIEQTIEGNKVIVSTNSLTKFSLLRDEIATKINNPQLQSNFKSKFDDWLSIIIAENIRVSTMKDFFEGLSKLSESITAIWDFESRLVNDMEIFLIQGESEILEFKEDIITNRTQLRLAKSIAALHNTKGGLAVIGIDNSNHPKGLAKDFQELNSDNVHDNFKLKVNRIIRDRLNIIDQNFATIHLVNYKGFELCVIKVDITDDYILLKDNSFYIRNGNEDLKLSTDKILDYTKKYPRKESN